jgi:hypothetical protein
LGADSSVHCAAGSPTTFIATAARLKLGYSAAELAKLLHLKVAEFEVMYSNEIRGIAPDGGGEPKLRLVK